MKGKSVGDKVIKRVLPIAFEKEKLIKDAHKIWERKISKERLLTSRFM